MYWKIVTLSPKRKIYTAVIIAVGIVSLVLMVFTHTLQRVRKELQLGVLYKADDQHPCDLNLDALAALVAMMNNF